MNLFLEGIESLKLACSLVLLIPALGISLMGKRRLWLVPIWIVTVSLIAWLRFSAQFNLEPSGWIHVASGAGLVGLAILAWRKNTMSTDAAATVGAAFIAGWTWIPCVGRELAVVLNSLNNGQTTAISQALPTTIYLTGLFVPLILIAGLQNASPDVGTWLNKPAVRTTGISVVFLVGGLVAAGLYDDLASELHALSSF